MQGGQQRTGRHVRRTHRLLGVVVVVMLVDLRQADWAVRPSGVLPTLYSLLSAVSLRYSAASAVTGECRRLTSLRSLSLSVCLSLTSSFTNYSATPAASCPRLYFTEKNFYVLFLIITIYFLDTGKECRPSCCVELALNCCRTFVQAIVSTVFAPQCCTVD